MSSIDDIEPELLERIRRELTRELRRKVEGEQTERIRRQVEATVRAEARNEMAQELAERAPTTGERQRFVHPVRDIEIDATAQARLASRLAHDDERALERSRKLANPLAYLLVLAAPLVVYGLSQWLGLAGGAFIATVITFALALITLLARNASRHGQLQRDARRHARIASDFMIVAERAKAYRRVHAERLTSSDELHKLLEDLLNTKEQRDRGFHPNAAALDALRDEVRSDLAEQLIDEQPRVRIDHDDVETPDPDASDAQAEDSPGGQERRA